MTVCLSDADYSKWRKVEETGTGDWPSSSQGGLGWTAPHKEPSFVARGGGAELVSQVVHLLLAAKGLLSEYLQE